MPRRPADPTLFWSATGILLVLMPLLALTHDVWIPATVAALALIGLFAVRRRRALRLSLVPWQALALAASLFVLVEAAHAQGLLDFLTSPTANGDSAGDLFRLAALGVVSANAINNLPAYLVLEPAAGDPVALMALLIGVNLGPLITPWASLATLLWHHRVVALGVTIRWSRFMLWGAVAAVPTVLAAVLVLMLVSG
ncbi:hypothetical protein GCM10010213_32080 [Microbacterium maritypicum]|uniref:Citrate transporter-like domain-containing protein n=2 Tax=Microbacterium TaxID=33882 RepID=A0A4Y4BEH7_MICMQ|nr:hypothetical protein MLI01_31880 [Microbacterium liquefaciens]GGV66028.1 hypothetical protein GCM10010213_32080 [Microbacterium liquefaciens]